MSNPNNILPFQLVGEPADPTAEAQGVPEDPEAWKAPIIRQAKENEAVLRRMRRVREIQS